VSGTALASDNLDVEVLDAVNGLADDTTWAHGFMDFMGEKGLLALLALLWLLAWWRARSRPDHTPAVAGLAWAPIAALIAEVVNMPLREWVDRPRPFLAHDEITVLVHGKTDPSFVSDHALLTMAIAIGILLVDRRIGAIAVVVSVLQGVCRLYVGVHYPTDVLGGWALGAFVALALWPVAMLVLVPVVRWFERTPLKVLAVSKNAPMTLPAGLSLPTTEAAPAPAAAGAPLSGAPAAGTPFGGAPAAQAWPAPAPSEPPVGRAPASPEPSGPSAPASPADRGRPQAPARTSPAPGQAPPPASAWPAAPPSAADPARPTPPAAAPPEAPAAPEARRRAPRSPEASRRPEAPRRSEAPRPPEAGGRPEAPRRPDASRRPSAPGAGSGPGSGSGSGSGWSLFHPPAAPPGEPPEAGR
jgi:undecaprenyl-diphosphatase